MNRKKQKLSLRKDEIQTQSQVEEIVVLRQKILSMEAEMKLKNDEKDHLVKRVTSLEQELVKKETQLKLKDKEKEHLMERVASLEQELAVKDTELKLKNVEQERIEKRVTSLEKELKKKETELQLIKEPFDALPNEVIVEIFKHLPQNELGKIALVCSRWNNLIKSPILWQNVDVEFHWSHISQSDVLKSFINKLPTTVTTIKVDFMQAGKWIEPLDCQELCAKLQETCSHLQKLILFNSKLLNTFPSIIDLCSEFLPSVTTLVFGFPKFLDSSASVQCGSTSNIEILGFIGLDITFNSKPIFSKMPKLKHLYLSQNYDIYKWFGWDVSFLNQLEILDLGYIHLASTAFHVIKNHGLNLKELYLCWSGLDDNDLKCSSSAFQQLKTVCLNHCNFVTGKGVVSLVKSCPFLQNIYVDECVARSYAKHPFIIANQCKLGIVKTVDCNEHDKKCYRWTEYNYS